MKNTIAILVGGACILGAWALWNYGVWSESSELEPQEARPGHASPELSLSEQDGPILAVNPHPTDSRVATAGQEPVTDDLPSEEVEDVAEATLDETLSEEELAFNLLLESGTPEQLRAEADRMEKFAMEFAEPELVARHERGLSRVTSTEVGPSHHHATKEERRLFMRVFMPQSGGTFVSTLPPAEYPELYEIWNNAKALRSLAFKRQAERDKLAAKK